LRLDSQLVAAATSPAGVDENEDNDRDWRDTLLVDQGNPPHYFSHRPPPQPASH
jgi:hypothetical protein